MTLWRWKSSTSLSRNEICFQHDRIVLSRRDFISEKDVECFSVSADLDFSKNFWKHVEWRRGILERDGRAVMVI